MKIKRKKGDTLWLDVVADNTDDVDTTWTNWTGHWVISETLGSTPILEGIMFNDTTTVGTLFIRIGASVMSALNVGLYQLACQIENVSVDYKQEIAHIELEITTQGVLTP